MPTQAPRFRHPGQENLKAWSKPKPVWKSTNEGERLRGRAGVAFRKKIREEEPLCRACLEAGVSKLTVEIDHIVALANGGTNDRSNMQGLCKECHEAKSASERGVLHDGNWRHRTRPVGLRPSRIPVVLVCGAPGSGKSTYVRNNSGPNDLKIDLDEIRCRLAGKAIHQAGPEWTTQALDERNRILASLADDHRHQRAWFIVGSPTIEEQYWWSAQLGAERIEVMQTSKDECIRRIWADASRAGVQQQMVKWVERWFDLAGGQ